MGLEEAELLDDDDSIRAKSLRSSNVSCSICLELVIFNNGRSCVKLICGHEFHLDCIGSAFNSRGAMQCPNCRNIEKGQWLYGSGGPVCDDPNDEEFYDLSYSEMFGGVRSHFLSFPLLSNHDLLGQHALFTEHAPVSSTSHPCPYFAYYGPIHSSPPNSSASFPDNSFSNHWSGPSEVPSSYALPAMDPHYPTWEHHSPPLPAPTNRLGNSDHQPSVPSITQRSARANSDLSRPDFFVHPFLVGHRASNNTVSPMIPPYPGSAPRTGEHVQAYLQPPNHSPPGRRPFNPPQARRQFMSSGLSSNRRATNHRSSSSLASSSDQSGNFYVFPSNASNRSFPEVENQMPPRSFHHWERERLASLFPPLNQVDRDPVWGPIHASGTSGFRPPQGRSQGRD
ncbi:hypothetical protein V2J09_023560 [Rumex salicifolius]